MNMAEMNRRKIQATLAFVFAGLLCSVYVHSQDFFFQAEDGIRDTET